MIDFSEHNTSADAKSHGAALRMINSRGDRFPVAPAARHTGNHHPIETDYHGSSVY